MKGIRLLRIAVVLSCLSMLLFSAGGVNAGITAGPNVWTQTGASGFGNINNQAISAVQMYNGVLYAGTINWVDGGSIWSSPDAKTWTQVVAPGVISSPVDDTGILGMTVYNGKLFVSTGWGGYHGQVWSYDGINWALVLDNLEVNGFTVFAAYGGRLYVGTSVLRTHGVGASIWSSATGDVGTWSAPVTNGLANPNSYSVTGLAVFNNVLYVGVGNDVNGAEIWSYDGSLWKTNMSGGFGDVNNQDTGGMGVFNGNLYIGVRNGPLFPASPTESTGGRLYRTADGTTWTPVIMSGFGNNRNVKVEAVFPFMNRLFATTTNPFDGMEVWTSYDGNVWSQAATNGFGNPSNMNTLWNNSIFTINNSIYIGTVNMDKQTGASVTGGQIFTYDPPLFQIYRFVLPVVFR